MSYTPNNPAIYIAAYAGAIAGMGVSHKFIISKNSPDYDGLSATAGAFAQQFDSLIPPSSATVPNALTQSVEQMCQATWHERTPQETAQYKTPASYNIICEPLVAVTVSLLNYYSANSIPTSPTNANALTQNIWYINPATGNNNRTGKTSAQAIKSFDEWTRRVGHQGVLQPTGGTLTIQYLGDATDLDPVVIPAITLGEKVNVQILGKATILHSGTFTAVTPKNKVTSTPNSVTAVGLGAAYIDKFIIVKTGAGAGSIFAVSEDVGGGEVYVSSWVTDAFDPDTTIFPGPQPAPGDTFDVVDYSTMRLGVCDIVQTTSDFPFGFAVGRATLIGDAAIMPVVTGPFLGAGGLVHCIVKTSLSVAGSSCSLSNCITTQPTEVTGSSGMNIFAGLGHPESGAEYPGYIRAVNGSKVSGWLGCLTNGDRTGAADIQSAWGCQVGFSELGMMNCGECIFPIYGGQIEFFPSDNFSGEIGTIQLWGKNNASNGMPLSEGGANSIAFNQFSFDTPVPILPTIQMGGGLGSPNYLMVSSDGPSGLKAHAWIPATGFGPAEDTTWAKFGVTASAAPGGGFEVERVVVPGPGGYDSTTAVATYPGTGSNIKMHAFNIHT